MGVQLSSLVQGKEIEIGDLAGKKVAIDAFNTIFQFISIIRDRFTGEPLKDSHGNVTSHLSGIMYRFSIMVFDGKPPAFKHATIAAREERKVAAEKKWKEAVAKGEDGKKYAQAASRMTPDILESSKKLLGYLGVPVIQAPSEGEKLCAALCREKIVDYAASQDYDSLLFGAPKMLRNLSLSGRKKLPGKEVWVEVKPEVIELQKMLDDLGINREQLITIGMLIGTDYNGGVKGVGPKTAIKLVKEHKTFDAVLKNVEWTDEIDPHKILEWFMNGEPTNQTEVSWGKVQKDNIIKFMVDEHDFSRERVEKILDKIESASSKGAQSSLGAWLKK
jgi:flap endonuclease-1